MKRALFTFGFVSLIVLSACGGEEPTDPENDVNENNDIDADTDQKEDTNDSDEIDEKSSEKDRETDENATSDIYGAGNIINEFKADSVKSSANVEFSINDMTISESDEGGATIAAQMSAENTTAENRMFYANHASLEIDGELYESDPLVSDSIGGELTGESKETGEAVYYVDVEPEDIKQLTFISDAPTDSNGDTIGDDIELSVNVE
ncbi:hypothetical protein [Texcoconibacillus texcoconensis]|uniref:DUF4352 domain-containing protein n=1 Tax=Texcoconibacillus texcoconensis TaxID=1095777 RepID=A0A840QQ83_9BACI|nr:hypothetical protein [Texcoconibacillus texcoconensis]MBB5173498.1 hypothetical protein [Texcoconibacillus texcoconensis]